MNEDGSIDKLPCEGCALGRYEDQMARSVAGQLLGRVVDLDFALEVGFQITFRDILAEEFRALKLLRFERARALEQKREREKQSRELPYTSAERPGP